MTIRKFMKHNTNNIRKGFKAIVSRKNIKTIFRVLVESQVC